MADRYEEFIQAEAQEFAHVNLEFRGHSENDVVAEAERITKDAATPRIMIAAKRAGRYLLDGLAGFSMTPPYRYMLPSSVIHYRDEII